MSVLESELRTLERVTPMRITGRVASFRGLTVLVRNLPVPTGTLVRVGHGRVLGEVVGFDGASAIVMTITNGSGVRSGDPVEAFHAARTVGVGESLLGRVIDGLGRPIDGKGPVRRTTPREIDADPTGPLQRTRITEPLHTGVRAIDLMTTLGRGQRIGVFAGPGVGKSTLLGSIARGTRADLSVIALVGERGREVRDFIEHALGQEGLARSVLIVSTSDESPLMRVRAAMVACAVAEHFRDHGAHVMLIVDSVTRYAHAQRQIGLSVGEPPATRGYTPSVFSSLARLLERAGTSERAGGSITGIYSVLVEGDDMTEPVADASRGILDGHVILSRRLAQSGHFPAIDVLDSVSRLAVDVCDGAHIEARARLIRLISAFRNVDELVQVGAYAEGADPIADVAILYRERFDELLCQHPAEVASFEESRSIAVKLAAEAWAQVQQRTGGRS